MKTIKFYTLGCKVNQYDTQSIREQFTSSGFKELENGEPADIYVINTCTVTHRADSDSFSFIRKAKRENPKAKIIVTGCLTELDAQKIKNVNRKVVIVKNSSKEDLLKKITNYQWFGRLTIPRIIPSAVEGLPVTNYGITYFKGHTRAFLKIQDGCNNYCSYCKVPLVRGVSRSKPLNDVVAEAEKLVGNGFKEIVLTGICLGAYGKDFKEKLDLVRLIEEIEKIDGLLRIRLSSIEAGDVSEGLIEKMAGSKKLCQHLHIPIQSGDDSILKKMHRRYTSKSYLDLIKKIKDSIPDAAITTDCLVGFPGETEENFKNTVRLIQQIVPLKVHIFPYSEREGTLASLEAALPSAIIKERAANLKRIADKCSLEYRKRFLNKTADILVESKAKGVADSWVSHTGNYIKVIIKSGDDLRNKLITVRLKKLKEDFLLAQQL